MGCSLPSPWLHPRGLQRGLAGLLTALTLVVSATGLPADAGQVSTPDLLIRRLNQSAFGGGGTYNTTGAGQVRNAQVAARGRARFYVELENDGRSTATFRLHGSAETDRFAVRYFLGPNQVSPQVKAGTFHVQLDHGEHRILLLEIEATGQARPGDRRRVVVNVLRGDGSVGDTVVAIATRPWCGADQQHEAAMVNQARASNGRSRLPLHPALCRKAQRWAQHMAAERRLSHSDLAAGVPPGWEALGENVGYGRSMAETQQAFMSSSPHRANVLGWWTHLGTGVAHGGGRLWIVQVFMRT